MTRKRGLLGFVLLVILVAAAILIFSAAGKQEPGAAGPKAVGKTAPPYYLKPGQPYKGQTVNVLLIDAKQYVELDKMIPEFEKTTGIKVNRTWTAFPALHEKLVSELVGGGGGFDVITYNYSWRGMFAPFLEPLDERVKQDGFPIEDYSKGMLDGCSFKGVLYGLPVRPHVNILFYRKDIFNQLGLSAPDTVEDVVEAAKAIKTKTDLAGIAMMYGESNPTVYTGIEHWASLLWSMGGDFFDKNMKPVFNSPAAIESCRRWFDFFFKYNVTPAGAEGMNQEEALVSFYEGRSAMVWALDWTYENMIDPSISRVVGKFGVAPIPKFKGKDRASYFIVMPWSIRKGSPVRDAAWEFLKWVGSAKVEKAIAMTNANFAIGHNSNLQDKDLNAKTDNLHLMRYEGLKNAKGIPFFPEWPECAATLVQAITSIGSGTDAKIALDEAAEKSEEILKKAGY